MSSSISAAPDRVFALLTNAASYPQWNPTVVKIDGTIALGEKIALVSTLDPKRTFKLRVAELDSPRRMGWSSGMPLGLFTSRTFTLEPALDPRAARPRTVSGAPDALAFEPYVGGRVLQTEPDGAEHTWGEVLAWETRDRSTPGTPGPC